MTIRTSLSALLLSAVGAGSVAAADCPACRDVKAPQDYLACMKACLAENSAQTTSVTTTSPLDKFAKDAESAGWTLSKNHDTVTDVTTVSVSKTSIEALKVSNQPMEVTLTFSADSKAVGGLYLRVPDLSNLKSIPFLSLFDSMAVSALFGNTVTARVDKNEATTLKVRSTKDGIYLEGSEKLLPQMTTGDSSPSDSQETSRPKRISISIFGASSPRRSGYNFPWAASRPRPKPPIPTNRFPTSRNSSEVFSSSSPPTKQVNTLPRQLRLKTTPT